MPEYAEVRTFAIERVRKLSLLEQRFEIAAELSSEAFGHSLGVNHGTPGAHRRHVQAAYCRVCARADLAQVAEVTDLPDGSVRMTLSVTADAALKTWILGFGSFAKVESPSWLAEEILEQLDEAREAYVQPLPMSSSRWHSR